MTEQTDKPKPRRRWLQYSLRTLFVLLTVFGVWLGVVVHRANEQRKAVEWVRAVGGVVGYDYQFDEEGSTIHDAKPPGPQWLVKLLGVDFFQEVARVDIWNTKGSDLAPLAKLTRLRQLCLHDTSISDLAHLAGLKNLEWLDLTFTRVSEEQVEELQRVLPNCVITR